jgi:hypothetical protein
VCFHATRITEGGQGIGADDIPAFVWEEREERSERQAAAEAALEAAKVERTAPIADIEQHEDKAVREAADSLRALRWLLVWPAEVVAEHIDAYRGQWGGE